jgi:hypothetical protein
VAPAPTDSILHHAHELVFGERNEAYGHPSENFDNIALLWNAYISIKQHYQGRGSVLLNNIDIAALNILQKVARVAVNQSHMDSWTDIAGYAGTAERIIRKI